MSAYRTEQKRIEERLSQVRRWRAEHHAARRHIDAAACAIIEKELAWVLQIIRGENPA